MRERAHPQPSERAGPVRERAQWESGPRAYLTKVYLKPSVLNLGLFSHLTYPYLSLPRLTWLTDAETYSPSIQAYLAYREIMTCIIIFNGD